MAVGQAGGFRADIEGLRAVAVLLVVACHVGVPGWSGGYVGVDVFFVISGYLISHLLQQEIKAQGRLDLLRFYARRINRLLPAFLLMVLTVLGLIMVLASPLEQPALLSSVLAAGLYISNLHFAAQALDYWSGDAKADFLLHTWSLGVEEQFYLVWPWLLLVLLLPAWRGRVRPGWVLPGLAGLSLLLAAGELHQGQALRAFYSPLGRVWEFAAGAMLALAAPWFRARAEALGFSRWWFWQRVLGMAALLLAAGLYDEHTRFPGVAALLPVGATVWLLWGQMVARPEFSLLASRPMQWLGRRSYGWYLWHWPLLVGWRMLWPEAGWLWAAVVAGLALLLADLSWRWLERPLRRHALYRSRRLALALLILVPGMTLGLGMYWGEQAAQRQQQPPFVALLATQGRVPALYQQGCDPGFEGVQAQPCRGGDRHGQRLLVVAGDSHAGQWAAAFDAVARAQGWRFLLYTKSACPLVDEVFFYPRLGRPYHECRRWQQAVLAELKRLQPDLLVLSASENYAFTPAQWQQGSLRMLQQLTGVSRQLVLLRDTPRPQQDIPRCLARRLWQPLLYREACQFVWQRDDSERLKRLHRQLLGRFRNAAYLDMTPMICADRYCSVAAGHLLKFRDSNHLSDAYALSLWPQLQQQLAPWLRVDGLRAAADGR